MTDLRKAAEMALKALIGAKIHDPEAVQEEIEALRQALAQPKQEPVAWVYRGILHEFDPSEWATSEVTPLYTAPPKREWVGLTDEQIYEHEWWDEETAYAVNKFLMEKNA